jgi:hypothetical protein
MDNSSRRMDSSARRRSSSSLLLDGSARSRRPSLLGSSLRRSSRSMQQSAMHEFNVSLGRIPTSEPPTTHKEMRARRSRRKSDYERQKEDRAGRMGSITDQWASHRKSFVSEEKELEELLKKNGRGSWCCGMNLCCVW